MWIAATISDALRKTGVSVESAGVVPTPAVAFLARTHGFDAGVVISASHNPWRDNGIKLFGPDGFKLPDAVESSIEDEIIRLAEEAIVPEVSALPRVDDNAALAEDYIQFLIDCVPGLRLDGLRIVADCANGALRQLRRSCLALGARILKRVYVTRIFRRTEATSMMGCGALRSPSMGCRGSTKTTGFDWAYLRWRRRPMHAGWRSWKCHQW